jgi:fructose-1-phosphate kinase PfkB-like protein
VSRKAINALPNSFAFERREPATFCLSACEYIQIRDEMLRMAVSYNINIVAGSLPKSVTQKLHEDLTQKLHEDLTPFVTVHGQ